MDIHKRAKETTLNYVNFDKYCMYLNNLHTLNQIMLQAFLGGLVILTVIPASGILNKTFVSPWLAIKTAFQLQYIPIGTLQNALSFVQSSLSLPAPHPPRNSGQM